MESYKKERNTKKNVWWRAKWTDKDVSYTWGILKIKQEQKFNYLGVLVTDEIK